MSTGNPSPAGSGLSFFVTNFLFGLYFGMGFMIAYAVLKLIAGLIGNAGHPIL